MPRLIIQALIAFFTLFASPQFLKAADAELLMFEEDQCSWCDKWNKEIGGIYHLTPQACHANLNRIEITEELPSSLTLLEPVVYTPTFVLIRDNREIGRITGYPGPDFSGTCLTI